MASFAKITTCRLLLCLMWLFSARSYLFLRSTRPTLQPSIHTEETPSTSECQKTLRVLNATLVPHLNDIVHDTHLNMPYEQLCRGLLSTHSDFFRSFVLEQANGYFDVHVGPWSEYDACIGVLGVHEPPPRWIGTKRRVSYSMKSGKALSFLTRIPRPFRGKDSSIPQGKRHAIRVEQEHEIVRYDSDMVVIRAISRSPTAPYGEAFETWLQYAVLSTGKDSCQLVGSVKTEFLAESARDGVVPAFVRSHIEKATRRSMSNYFEAVSSTAVACNKWDIN